MYSENIIFHASSLPMPFFFLNLSTSATINENSSFQTVRNRTDYLSETPYIDVIHSHSSVCNQQFVMLEIHDFSIQSNCTSQFVSNVLDRTSNYIQKYIENSRDP